VIVSLEVDVQAGVVGFGCLDHTGQIIVERQQSVSYGKTLVDLRLDSLTVCRSLILRNTSSENIPSSVAIFSVIVRPAYPALVVQRSFESEPVPAGGGVEQFDTPAARAINRARLDHLASLDLDLQGKRVLDVGAGVGHLAQFFVQRGCTVVCIEGRPENVARLRELYPGLEAHVCDVDNDPFDPFGEFDVVFAYGLLYHLEDPVRVLRKLATVCTDVLVLETMICDHSQPILLLDDETRSLNQALRGIGSRPSPSFVAMALNRVGFPFVYGARIVPDYEDYRFIWQDDLAWFRDGHPLRCVFVASRRPLSEEHLVSLITES
jgi:SAM-dependent methyltransferase